MKTSFWKKLAKGALYFVAFLVTAIVLFYSVTSYFGRREWAATKKALEDRGEKLALADFIPPPIPDELNFFAAPSFVEIAGQDLVEVEGESSPGPRVPHAKQRLTTVNKAVGSPFRYKRSPSPVLTDLAVAADYYQSEGKVPASARPAAEVVLEALDPARSVVDEIALYAERPGARFPIRYGDGIAAHLPHLGHLLTLSKYLSLRAIAWMELGRGDEAARDILLILRLADSMKGEPMLITLLARFSVVAIANRTLWEGIARSAWDDSQLAVFEGRLRGYDLLLETQGALRAERSMMLTALESALQGATFGDLVRALTESKVESSPWPLANSFYPKGWVYADMARIATVQQKWLDLLDDRDIGLRPTGFEFRTHDLLESSFLTKIQRLLSANTLPSLAGIVPRGFYAQAGIDQTRAALALERYRLANGDFPSALAPLVPQFIAAVPTDVMTGQPLQYRRISPEDFILWSIGWDAIDDGGKAPDSDRNPLTQKGDWVWTRQPTES